MALVLPQPTDLLSADDHARLHRVFAADSASPDQSITVNPDGSANFRLPYVAKTANYNVAANDCIIDCTSGTFTVTLPTAVGITGDQFIIKNSGTGVITVATTSSQTIDANTTYLLSVQYSSITVVSDGANWKIKTSN